MNYITHNALYLRLITAQVFPISVTYISCHSTGELCEVLFLPRPTFLSVLPVTTDLCVRPRTVYLTLWFSAACPCDLISGLSTTSPVCRLPRPKPGNRLWVWSCLHYPCRWYLIFACLTLSLIKAANGSPCLRPFVTLCFVFFSSKVNLVKPWEHFVFVKCFFFFF